MNAAFIAHARADIPALIAEVRRLQKGLYFIVGMCNVLTPPEAKHE